MARRNEPDPAATAQDDGAWFAPKRYGYGSGLPLAWQGWLVLTSYVAFTLGCGLLIEKGEQLIGLVLLIPATLAMIWIAKARTRGGWRWRWGDDA